MKKGFGLLLTIFSMLACLAACQKDNTESSNLSCAHDNVGTNGLCTNCQEYILTDNVIYRVSKDGTYAEACGYQGNESAWKEGKSIWLVVAKEYNGLPVTKIADNAFKELGYAYNGFINGVHLPDSITHIGDWAFEQCLNLTTIHLPSNLTYIGEYAFKQTDLASVKIPDGVTCIGDGAFRECEKLTTVEMGTGVMALGDFVFGGCRSLTSITIPNGITSIGEQVFENCDKLEEVKIPDNITSIGASAFVDCDNLQYVEIGNGVEAIRQGAFDKCKNLTAVLLGEKVQSISSSAFDNCEKLSTVYYKGNESEWGEESFNVWDDPDYIEQFAKATVYFYSEDMPIAAGNYWCYDQEGNPAKWTFVQNFFEFIDRLEKSDIQKIETVEYAGSISPIHRAPVEYKTSTLATDIESIYDWLCGLQEKLTPISDQEAQVEGGGAIFLTVYTDSGVFKMNEGASRYLRIWDKYYAQEGKMPKILGETVTYKFESYFDQADIYKGSIDGGVKVGTVEFPFEEMVCKISDKIFSDNDELFKIVANIGELIVYDKTHFKRNGTTYEIVNGKDFSQIIETYFLELENEAT